MKIKLHLKPKVNLEITALHTTSSSSYNKKNCGGYKRNLMSVNLFLEAESKQGPSHKDSALGLWCFSLSQINLDSQQGQMLLRDIYYLLQECKKLVMKTCLLVMVTELYIYI